MIPWTPPEPNTFNGLGYCTRCARTWDQVEPHIIMMSEDHGIFLYCESCWKVAPRKERRAVKRVTRDYYMATQSPYATGDYIELQRQFRRGIEEAMR